MNQLRIFYGLQTTVEALKEADAAIAKLSSGESIAAKRWAIDRLVLVAQDHEGLRSRIAERLADFVREQTALESVRNALRAKLAELEADSLPDSSLEDILNRKFPTPVLADYAFRQLGKKPLAGAQRTDDSHLNLRGIVIPQARARGARLRRVDLSGAILIKSALADIQLESCNLTGAVFSRSRMERCAIDEATSYTDARFVGVKADDARVGSKELRNVLLASKAFAR